MMGICQCIQIVGQSTNNNHNCMNKILYLLIIAICLPNFTHSQDSIYNGTFTAPISGGTVVDADYSPDQKYVAIIMNSRVVISDGVTAVAKFYGNYPTGLTYSAFSFAQDSQTFAVGFTSTDGSSNLKIYTAPKGIQLDTLQLNGSGNPAAITVKSLCFTADNKRLVYSTSQGEIYSYKLDDKSSNKIIFDTIPASTIACSPRRSLQFAAGGSNPVDGKQSKLKLFNIDPITNKIPAAIHEFALTDPDETITGLTYSQSSTHLYLCGSKQVYKIGVDSHLEEVLIAARPDLKDFVKIRVTNDEKVLGVSTKTKQLHLVKYTPDANAQTEQTITMYIQGFGLSPNSLNIFYMTTATSAQLSSQCKSTQILNIVDGTCIDCNANCLMCLDSATTCRSCNPTFYLSETTSKCESCVARCKACVNGVSCTTCADPFILKSNKLCGCADGKYVNGNVCSSCIQNCKTCTTSTTCSTCNIGYFAQANTCTACAEGCQDCSDLKTCTTCSEDFELENGICETKKFPVWAIILLVVLALSVVIIVLGVVYIKMRRQKKSPLLTDSDEAAATLE